MDSHLQAFSTIYCVLFRLQEENHLFQDSGVRCLFVYLFVFAGLQALKKAGRYCCGSKLLILFVLPFSRCDACPCTSHHHKQLMTASGSSMTADALDFVSLALFHLALQKQARLVHKKQRALLRHLYGDYIVNQFILHNPMDHLLLMIRHFSSSDNLSIK